MKFLYFYRTDCGRSRKLNEDAYGIYCGKWWRSFFVADGVGGAKFGREASRVGVLTTIQSLKRHLRREGVTLTLEALQEAALAAHNRVTLLSKARDNAKIGSTLSGIVFENGYLSLLHVGDSRVYLLRDDKLQLLTADHTVTNQLVKDGIIHAKDVLGHIAGHLLTSALGVDKDFQFDAKFRLLEVKEDDLFILTTDGITGGIKDEELKRVALRFPVPLIPTALIKLANRRGGPDNSTVIVVKVGPNLRRRDSLSKRAKELVSGKRLWEKIDIFAVIFLSTALIIAILLGILLGARLVWWIGTKFY